MSRRHLNVLISQGAVEQLARNIYRIPATDIDEEEQYRLATLRAGTPSAICLISALAYYGLTDTIPKVPWIMVPHTKRSAYRDLKVVRRRNPQWTVGIVQSVGYSITNVERTLVDCLTFRSNLRVPLATEGLRRAIATNVTRLGDVMEVAEHLGVIRRIRPYIEVLS